MSDSNERETNMELKPKDMVREALIALRTQFTAEGQSPRYLILEPEIRQYISKRYNVALKEGFIGDLRDELEENGLY